MSDEKGPILPNDFKAESKPDENDPKKAHHSPESDEKNAQNAHDWGPLPSKPSVSSVQSVASSPGEGLGADKLKADKLKAESSVQSVASSPGEGLGADELKAESSVQSVASSPGEGLGADKLKAESSVSSVQSVASSPREGLGADKLKAESSVQSVASSPGEGLGADELKAESSVQSVASSPGEGPGADKLKAESSGQSVASSPGEGPGADKLKAESSVSSVQSVASSPGEGLGADKLKAESSVSSVLSVADSGSKSKRGPKTAEGKARSSRNAVKHGIRSPHPFIIEGLESPGEWEEFKLGIIESWQPVGMQELELAINVAWDHWKLRRCRRHENALLSKQVEETEEELQHADADGDDFDEYGELLETAQLPPVDPERLVYNQHLKVIPDGWSMDSMLRYEAQVRKALNQDMNMLEVQQARRQGERTPLARVQVDSGPSFTKPRNSANDIPAFQIAQTRLRLAEHQLAERKRAARAEKAAHA